MSDITVRITPAVAAEYVSREIPERPFSLITDPGTYHFSPEEAASLLGDADYYSSTNGPGESLTFGQRRAYAALAAQLRKAGVDLTDRDKAANAFNPDAAPMFEVVGEGTATVADDGSVELEIVPVPAPRLPRPIGELPLGTRFKYKGTILTIDPDQSDARTGYRFVIGGQRGLAFPVERTVVPL